MKYLTEEEEFRVRTALQNFHVKHQLPVIIGLDLGLRSCEILEIDVENIRDRSTIYVKTRKKGLPRTLPLTPRIQELVSKYLQNRTSGKLLPLTRRQLFYSWELVRRASNVRLEFHGLRHTFAMRLIKSGAHIFVVQKALGHKSLSNTGIYLHCNIDDLTKAMETRESNLPNFKNPDINPLWKSETGSQEIRSVATCSLQKSEQRISREPCSIKCDGTNGFLSMTPLSGIPCMVGKSSTRNYPEK